MEEDQIRILAAGSRDWPYPSIIRREIIEIEDYAEEEGYLNHPLGVARLVLVHGACRGPDRQSSLIARERGWTVEPCPADWGRRGKQAGFIRNKEMAESHIDWAVLFIYRYSPGSSHMLRLCKEAKIPRRVIRGERVRIFR